VPLVALLLGVAAIPSASPWSGTSPRSVGLAAAVVGIIERRIVELERELGIRE
jgi:hypothetical protein